MLLGLDYKVLELNRKLPELDCKLPTSPSPPTRVGKCSNIASAWPFHTLEGQQVALDSEGIDIVPSLGGSTRYLPFQSKNFCTR